MARTIATGIRGRAEHRLTTLENRLRLMEVVAALASRDRLNLLHAAACAERASIDTTTSERMAELTRKLVTSEQALAHTESSGVASAEAVHTADAARSEIHRLNSELTSATDDRVEQLGRINDRIAAMARERLEAENRLADAMRAAGIASADLYELLERIGHPEASELLDCASRHRRAGRAAYLLELMRGEVEVARNQRDAAGLNPAYDQALAELFDAEFTHAHARRKRDDATRDCERALRTLLRAAAALARLAPAPTSSTTSTDLPAAATGSATAGSEPGAQPEPPASQGPGTPVTDRDPVGDSRSDAVHRDLVESAPEVAQS